MPGGQEQMRLQCTFIFLFYFHCILCHRLYQLSACTSVTCILKDQSIKSINQAFCDSSGVRTAGGRLVDPMVGPLTAKLCYPAVCRTRGTSRVRLDVECNFSRSDVTMTGMQRSLR